MFLIADRRPLEVRGRDVHDQGLPPGPRRSDQHIHQLPVLLSVQFVNDRTMGVVAMLGAGVGADRLERTAHGLDRDRLGVDAARIPQDRFVIDHLLGHVENQRGLVPLRGRTVDLGPPLPITEEHVDADPRREDALAILPGHEDERFSITTRPVGSLPAEEVGYDRLLPGLEQEGPAREFSLDVHETVGEEADDLVRCLLVEPAVPRCGLWIVARDKPDHVIPR